MRPLETKLNGPIAIAPEVHADGRGFFLESYRESRLRELGIEHGFVQDNHSRSRQGVVRGLHFQVGDGQAKLVRCVRGRVLDVVVDIRRGSPTWAQWEAHVLDDKSHHQLYCPVGFAHGFCVLSDVADVTYKCSSYYAPDLEMTIAFDDPEIGIEWPDLDLLPSERDAGAPRLSEVADRLPFVYSDS
jgi:dTDP-4-dehydrorhamnose 3,5-epimerase